MERDASTPQVPMDIPPMAAPAGTLPGTVTDAPSGLMDEPSAVYPGSTTDTPAATPEVPAATPPAATPAPKDEMIPVKRYKDLQAFATRLSQENKALKQQQPQKPAESSTPAEEPILVNGKPYDHAEFERMVDDEGFAKATAYRDAYLREQTRRDMLEVLNQKQTQEQQGQLLQQEIEQTVQLFDRYGIDEQAFAQIDQLRQQEAQRGFNISPEASILLQKAGGNWDHALAFMQYGMQAYQAQLAAQQAPAIPTPPPPAHPGFPGGSGRQAAPASAGAGGYFSPQDFGL